MRDWIIKRFSLLTSVLQWRPWRKTTPGRHERKATAGVVHRGADLGYGAELKAMGKIEVAPELVSEIEKELEWGLIWHEFESKLQAEVDRIFAPGLIFAEIDSFEQLRELVEV